MWRLLVWRDGILPQPVSQLCHRLRKQEQVGKIKKIWEINVSVPEWSNGVDCKSIVREFESHPALKQ